MNSNFAKYCLVGVANTIFGYSLIFVFMYIGLTPEISNFIGYFFGIILSYFLNKYYTFKIKTQDKKEFVFFFASMIASYIINLAVLIICYKALNLNTYLSQIIAGIFYTISGFLFSKYFVFKTT